MLKINGIYPPLPTSFDKYGEVDDTMIKENIQRLARHGLAGILVLGSNGEAVMLDEKEKGKVFAAAREAIPGGRLMIAGTGCLSTRETIRTTRLASSNGADAALVLNPYYYKGQMTREALVGFYHEVADESEIPVIVYNMPGNSGMDMDAETILEISHHPNIIGLKDSGGNVAKMSNIIGAAGDQFQVLAGSAGFLLPALSVGAVGGILALCNIAPALCLGIYDHFREGKLAEARNLQHIATPVNAAVTARWGIPALKAAMDHLGLYGGPVRKPLLEINPADREKLLKLLKEKDIEKYI